MKLWVKIVKGEKLLADRIFRTNLPLEKDSYEEYLQEICRQLDLSTPVSLSSHWHHLERFHIAEYKPRDFIEAVDFDKVIIEDVDYD